ncbi:reverse transcriptase domain-containing protein [Tanacetum coccineum]
MKCQPLNFKGTEGVVELIQWLEKMEIVFSISNYSVENQIKFSTYTLLTGTLTWWNSHVRTVGHDVAYAMTWTDLKKKMTNKYCPRVEIKKLEAELWNLKVKGTDMIGYNQLFQELALLCVRMFPEESAKIKRYVDGFPDMIHGSRTLAEPTLHDLVRRSHTRDLNPYALNATITMMVHVLPNATSATELAISPVTVGVPPMPTLLITKGALGQEMAMLCGRLCRDKPRLQHRDGSQIDISPTVLDHYYDVELADERIIRLNTILRGCTLNFLNHLFNIDLMPVELGSLDVIIGMDWLAKYQAVIVYAEKIVRIP